ncbi:MAG: hypothetical protein ABW075_13360 [Aeromicrobium sp.]
MKRILVAAGSLAVVLVTAVGAVALVGDTGEPVPAPTTTSPASTAAPQRVDESVPFDREALEEQAKEQARQAQAAEDDLEQRVADEASRLNQGN